MPAAVAALVLMCFRGAGSQGNPVCIAAIRVQSAQPRKGVRVGHCVFALKHAQVGHAVTAPTQEVRMRCVAIATAILLSCSASFAQVGVPAAPSLAMGAPSPDSTEAPSAPGENAAQAAIGGAGVPLGTTELFAGGLSPAPTDATVSPTCPGAGTSPGVGTLGTGSIFAGNGTMSALTSDLSPSASVDPTDSNCGAAATAGAGPLGLTSTLGAASAFAGGAIPLGAGALSTAGLGGIIGIPTPGGPARCSSTGSVVALGTGLANSGAAAMLGVSTPNSC
jgi:hypothetical protein